MSAFALPLRRATPADLPALAALYASSIRALGPQLYTPQQIEAWAYFASTPAFTDFVLKPRTLVAEDASGILGFAGVEQNGHVASLYVRADATRGGIGSQLLTAVIEQARQWQCSELFTEASFFSRQVFERHGFAVTEVQSLLREGVPFRRYKMRREM